MICFRCSSETGLTIDPIAKTFIGALLVKRRCDSVLSSEVNCDRRGAAICSSGSKTVPIGSMISSARTKRPLPADPLSAIAPLLRVRPEIQEICRFAARWEAEHQAEPLGWAQFHIVTKGRCFLEQHHAEPLLMQAGHLLLLPHGD